MSEVGPLLEWLLLQLSMVQHRDALLFVSGVAVGAILKR